MFVCHELEYCLAVVLATDRSCSGRRTKGKCKAPLFSSFQRVQTRTVNAYDDDQILSGSLVNKLCCQKWFGEISDQFIIILEPFVCQSYILLKCFFLKFYVFLGLSRSFFVRLMVLYLQSMVFTLIVVESFFSCWLSKKYVYVYIYITRSLNKAVLRKCKPGLWMLDVFKLSVLAAGASKVPSIKTQALRLIHLLKGLRPIKSWASHLQHLFHLTMLAWNLNLHLRFRFKFSSRPANTLSPLKVVLLPCSHHPRHPVFKISLDSSLTGIIFWL